MEKEDELDREVTRMLKRMSLQECLSLLDGDLPLGGGLWQLLVKDRYHKRPFPAGRLPQFGLPGLQFVDGPRGVVLEGGATTFPVAMARAASFDPALEVRVGEAIAKELRSFGGNLFGGVCVNLLRHPAWGRAQECYGEDPVLAASMGAAAVRGVQRHALACVKHFAANSMEDARFTVDVTMSQRVLHELYLPHFKACVDAGAAAVMTAYNSLNGSYCGENSALIRDVLKERWGFRGLVLSDFVFGLRDAKKAMEAGLDLEMPFRFLFHGRLKRLVENGRLDSRIVEDAARRVLRQQLAVPKGDYPPSLRGCQDHRELAREAAVASMVLLKNERDALPIADGETVVLFGALAARANLGDRGSSDGRPDSVVTLLDGMRKEFGPRLSYCKGRDPDAVAAEARRADVAVVVVGYTHRDEGESILPSVPDAFVGMLRAPRALQKIVGPKQANRWWRRGAGGVLRGGLAAARSAMGRGGQSFGLGGDRRSLSLSAEHCALIQNVASQNERTLVAVMAGSAVVMQEWDSAVAAIMFVFYPGMFGGDAFAELLAGRRSPSGRLPFVIPRTEKHLPDFDADARSVVYDLFHGYRYLHRNGSQAAYPFGFGVGYSRFELRDLKVDVDALQTSDCLVLTARLRNCGAMAAAEVVQLYVGALGSQVERPMKELKAFDKVHLQAGQERALRFRVPLANLAYFDAKLDRFVIEATDYRIWLGRHADDPDALQAGFQLLTERHC